jgi:hypothetical protein
MTPQGIADALDELVTDLPGQKERLSGSWQKVLSLQVLNGLLEEKDGPVNIEVGALRRIVAEVLEQAVQQLFREQPTLGEAMFTAFDTEHWDWMGMSPPRTDFEASPLGKFMVYVVHQHWNRMHGPLSELLQKDELP